MIGLGRSYKYWLGPTLEVVRHPLVVGRRFQMDQYTPIGCSIVFGQMCCFVVRQVCCGNFARLFGVVPMLASVHILVHQRRRLLLGAIFCNTACVLFFGNHGCGNNPCGHYLLPKHWGLVGTLALPTRAAPRLKKRLVCRFFVHLPIAIKHKNKPIAKHGRRT